MKKLFLLLSLALTTTVSQAQITYHDIVPDTTFAGAPGLYSLKPVAGGPEIVIRYYSSPISVTAEAHGGLELLYKDGYPAKLKLNDTINASSTSWTPAGLALSSEGNGNWVTDATDKYLAFRFKKTTTAWHYGWLKMSVIQAGVSVTVMEWGYHSEGGKTILAGQKNGTTGIGTFDPQSGVSISQLGRAIRFNELPGKGKYTLMVTGMDGRCLLKKEIAATETTDLGALAAGTYAIQLFDSERRYRFKVSMP